MSKDLEARVQRATQAGLPRVPRPYEAIARELGVTEAAVLQALRAMLADGRVRRIGVVPNHYAIGYVANGMSVWDVDDARVDALGQTIGQLPGVTHCYRRTRRPPEWPYNLFVMLHGRSRPEVERQARVIAQLLGDACRAHDILYSTQLLKKTGFRLSLP